MNQLCSGIVIYHLSLAGAAHHRTIDLIMTGSLWRVGTIRIGRIGSIAVDLHFTFIFVILWGAWQGWFQHGGLDGAAYGVLVVILLFVSIFIHELAHGLQARYFGLVVRRITLLPIGGLAELETPPAYPRHELLIALVGPLSNLAIALVLGGISYLIEPFTFSSWIDQALLYFFSPPSVAGLLTYLVGANAMLFIFNMVPAFPMDGGRVVRAGLAVLFNYHFATEVTTWSARLMAAGFVVLGLIGWPPSRVPPNPPLVIIAVMIAAGARQEQISVRRQHALTRVEAREVATSRSDSVSPWDTIGGDLLARLYRSNQTLPVLVEESRGGAAGLCRCPTCSTESRLITNRRPCDANRVSDFGSARYVMGGAARNEQRSTGSIARY